MSTFNIITVFDSNGFVDNNGTYQSPIGGSSYERTSCTFMLTDDITGVTHQGDWNLGIQVQNGDVIQWWDTTINQGSGQYDLAIYGMDDLQNWTQYLSSISTVSKQIHTVSFPEGFDTNDPTVLMNSYTNSVNSVTNAPTSDVTLSYYIQVAKYDLYNLNHTTGQPTLVGTYQIDPSITIKAS